MEDIERKQVTENRVHWVQEMLSKPDVPDRARLALQIWLTKTQEGMGYTKLAKKFDPKLHERSPEAAKSAIIRALKEAKTYLKLRTLEPQKVILQKMANRLSEDLGIPRDLAEIRVLSRLSGSPERKIRRSTKPVKNRDVQATPAAPGLSPKCSTARAPTFPEQTGAEVPGDANGASTSSSRESAKNGRSQPNRAG